jgi:hypothetical protein
MKSLLVSVNYSDYLECVLPMNNRSFEEIIVVTVKSDVECQRICKQYSNVTCIVAPDSMLKENGAVFNKGALLNQGMRYLISNEYAGYLCLTDSDVIFNDIRLTEHVKELTSLGINCRTTLMGMARYIIESCEDYITWKNNPNLDHKFLKRLGDEKERTLLGYAQIFYFDYNDKWRDHLDRPVWELDENCYNAQQVDAKFIGNFLNRAKSQDNWRKKTVNNTDTYRFERLIYSGNTEGLEYGVHIEDSNLYCIHVGETWLNRDGRITDKWINI